MTRQWSLPFGAVTLTERFLTNDPPTPEQIDRLHREIARRVPRVTVRARELVGVGGTVAAVALLAGRRSVPRTTVVRLRDQLTSMTDRKRRRLGLPAGRSDVIVAGISVLTDVMDHLGAKTLRTTTEGLRHALLLETALETAG